jgi:hypothetical protein
MWSSKHPKQSLHVTTNVEHHEAPRTKKDKPRTKTCYTRTQLKPMGEFAMFYTLKAKCHELEREEQHDIKQIHDAQH